jgi:hypothetical protein
VLVGRKNKATSLDLNKCQRESLLPTAQMDFLQSTLELCDGVLAMVDTHTRSHNYSPSSSSSHIIPPLSIPPPRAPTIPKPHPLLRSWGYSEQAASDLSDVYSRYAKKQWNIVESNYWSTCQKLSLLPGSSSRSLDKLYNDLYDTMVNDFRNATQQFLQDLAPPVPTQDDTDLDPSVRRSLSHRSSSNSHIAGLPLPAP